MNKFSLSVVVCTYNRSKLLEGCLKSLSNQSLSQTRYEVIIIDNNSSDDTKQLTDKYIQNNKNFRYFKEFNQGLSHSRNRGAIEACFEYVAYIDDDARAEYSWCEKIIEAFEKNNGIPVATGGQIIPLYDKNIPDWYIKSNLDNCHSGYISRYLKKSEVSCAYNGSNFAVKKSIIIESGGFSTKFGMNGNNLALGEETAFFNEISKKYNKFYYDPEIKVFHISTIKNVELSYRFKRSFKAGISNYQINNLSSVKKSFYFKYFKAFKNLLFFLLKLILMLLKSLKNFNNIKLELLKIFDYIGFNIGYTIAMTDYNDFTIFNTRF